MSGSWHSSIKHILILLPLPNSGSLALQASALLNTAHSLFENQNEEWNLCCTHLLTTVWVIGQVHIFSLTSTWDNKVRERKPQYLGSPSHCTDESPSLRANKWSHGPGGSPQSCRNLFSPDALSSSRCSMLLSLYSQPASMQVLLLFLHLCLALDSMPALH